MRQGWIWVWAAACALAMAPAAYSEPVLARCKVERTIDLSVSPQKMEKRPDSLRANALFDWLFVYDLSGSKRLCHLGDELCNRTANGIVETDGRIQASTADWPTGAAGSVSLYPSTGRWIFQQDLFQTIGGKGDCTFSKPTEHQVALLTLNPALDRDVLCASRLAVEADILNAQNQYQPAQSALRWAQSLLDRTVNRGYDRAARDAAVNAERTAYAARDEAGRQADFAPCLARMSELQR